MTTKRKYKLTEAGHEILNNAGWGGARPGAGRPRTETLDATECWFLADLLEQQPDPEQFVATIARLRRMAEKAAG